MPSKIFNLNFDIKVQKNSIFETECISPNSSAPKNLFHLRFGIAWPSATIIYTNRKCFFTCPAPLVLPFQQVKKWNRYYSQTYIQLKCYILAIANDLELECTFKLLLETCLNATCAKKEAIYPNQLISSWWQEPIKRK